MHAVAAPVVIVGAVQRLVKVADEVQQVDKRQDALGLWRAPIRQLLLELLDLVDLAVLSWPLRRRPVCRGEAKAGGVQVRVVQLDVGEVPARRLSMAGAAVGVSPGRPRRHVPAR